MDKNLETMKRFCFDLEKFTHTLPDLFSPGFQVHCAFLRLKENTRLEGVPEGKNYLGGVKLSGKSFEYGGKEKREFLSFILNKEIGLESYVAKCDHETFLLVHSSDPDFEKKISRLSQLNRETFYPETKKMYEAVLTEQKEEREKYATVASQRPVERQPTPPISKYKPR